MVFVAVVAWALSLAYVPLIAVMHRFGWEIEAMTFALRLLVSQMLLFCQFVFCVASRERLLELRAPLQAQVLVSFIMMASYETPDYVRFYQTLLLTFAQLFFETVTEVVESVRTLLFLAVGVGVLMFNWRRAGVLHVVRFSEVAPPFVFVLVGNFTWLVVDDPQLSPLPFYIFQLTLLVAILFQVLTKRENDHALGLAAAEARGEPLPPREFRPREPLVVGRFNSSGTRDAENPSPPRRPPPLFHSAP